MPHVFGLLAQRLSWYVRPFSYNLYNLIVNCHVLMLNVLIKMDKEIVLFIISAGLLVVYLVFSALTEMGTKLPWKK